MTLRSPAEIKELLGKYGASPDKALGQNFLVNEGVLQKIVQAARLSKETEVLEIGPGLGALTQALALKAKRVVAIEKDPLFAELLSDLFANRANVEIVHQDILNLPKASFPQEYQMVANLPYSVAAAAIQKLLYEAPRPKRMVVMVQKEVAQRITARSPDMNMLALSVQYTAEARVLFPVSKGSFWPAPKVDSAVVEIVPFQDLSHLDKADWLFHVARAGFSSPRKQLLGNLASGLNMERTALEETLQHLDISPSRRAETLSVEEWASLAQALQT